jgi:rare lipoprotein A
MNHKRWTCLTTAVLTAILAPMTAVYATIRPSKKPVAINRQISKKISSPTAPTISPLTVTELETDVAVPKVVARVSRSNVTSDIDFIPPIEPQLPHFVPANTSIAPQASSSAVSATPIKQVPRVAKLPNLNLVKVAQPPQFIQTDRPLPTTLGKLPQHSTLAAKPIDRQLASLPKSSRTKTPPHSPTPNLVTKNTQTNSNPSQLRSITDSPAVTLPAGMLKTERQIVAYVKGTHLVTRNHQSIVNSALVEADIPAILPVVPSKNIVAEIPEIPNFESETPVFIFSGEQPRQIIATAIAQVGKTGELAAPETSISIPVAPPKQPNTSPKSAPLQPTQVVPVTPIPVEPLTPVENVVATQTGQASWYGLEAGPKTANGERYNPKSLTAAHRSLPFGTRVRVINIKNGQSVTVRINDRGPFTRGRVIDVSERAAEAIGIKRSGVGQVRLEILEAAKPEIYN